MASALNRAKAGLAPVKTYRYPIVRPTLMQGVVPTDAKAPVLAMDEAPGSYGQAFSYAQSLYGGVVSGFPGYPYLAMLATRAEYRQMASSLAAELTREWIVINSSSDNDVKVTELTQAMKDFGVQAVIQRAAEHDSYYGRGQIYIKMKTGDPNTPLVISEKTIKKGSLVGFQNIEPMWTTPVDYNATDPTDENFYKPTLWFSLSQRIHSSRLATVITREVPDILKPAFNFSGMSLSQLAEPYVDNWLTTRQSVADLLRKFSITALGTNMSQVLMQGGDGSDLMARAEYFNVMRANNGLMLFDKDTEEMVQLNAPLSGLHELQAASQEHMCAVSHMPAIILTGISPGGLNASSDSEMRAFYDWTAGVQEAFYRVHIETFLKIIQLHLYGSIDPDINFTFQPLYQMTPKELADIRQMDSVAAGNYIDRGVIAPDEERERIARDPLSGYQGLDLNSDIEPLESNDDEESD